MGFGAFDQRAIGDEVGTQLEVGLSRKSVERSNAAAVAVRTPGGRGPGEARGLLTAAPASLAAVAFLKRWTSFQTSAREAVRKGRKKASELP